MFFTYMEHCEKRLFVGFRKYGFLADLQVRMFRDSRFLLFSHHNYQVSLNKAHKAAICKSLCKLLCKSSCKYVKVCIYWSLLICSRDVISLISSFIALNNRFNCLLHPNHREVPLELFINYDLGVGELAVGPP